MTALVATVGMLPAALATGVGSDVQRSVATVVAGGLLIATLLTLFIVPTIYCAVERRWISPRSGGQDCASRASLLDGASTFESLKSRD
jgi:cobalt-zinc-cadmium resistance protein CzcA